MNRFVAVQWLFAALLVATSASAAKGQGRISDLPESEEDTEFIFQPAPTPAPAPERAEPPRQPRRSSRNDYVRISRVPNMFGDSLGIGGQISSAPGNNDTGVPDQRVGTVADLPLGFGRSYKVGENNKPIPMDRVFFVYNGFRNAMQTTAFAPGLPGRVFDGNVDLYTLGFEKTFRDEQNSIEVRLPFLAYQSAPGSNDTIYNSGNMGDMALFYKHLLYSDEQTAMAIGLGLGLPTSTDITGMAGMSPFRINTDAIHLMPYVGMLTAPNEDWFFQGYLQLDFAATGNRIDSSSPFIPQGTLTEQNLLIADFSMGRWLYHDEESEGLQGIAAIFELHYTTTIQDADVLRSDTGPLIGGTQLGNIYNRLDVLNLTAGLQFQLTRLSNLRVGCVVPVRSPTSDRQFDSEIQVSFNRFF